MELSCNELEILIPNAGFEELKQITDTVEKDKSLYSHITLNRILKMISIRLRELGPPVKFPLQY